MASESEMTCPVCFGRGTNDVFGKQRECATCEGVGRLFESVDGPFPPSTINPGRE